MSQTRHYEMKDSGVEWIGKMPSHWEMSKMKRVLRNASIKGHPEAQVLSLYREYGVIPKDSRNDNHNVTSEDTASYKYVEAGDLVINKMKAWQGSLGLSQYEGIVSPAYYVCKVNSMGIVPRYLHHLIRSKTYAQEFERLSTGMRIGQWDLGIDDFLRVPLLLPPFSEQTAIAAYLDEKCATIDAIIAEAKATIDEYKAWKASVIFEAVTKGLNPNAEMKDSGVEWIGEMPKDWNIVRFKRMHRGSNVGLSLDKDYWSTNEDDTVFYTAGLKSIHTSYKDIEPDMLTKENDLLLARNGTPYVYFPSIGAIYTDHIIRVGIENGYNKAFVRYCLQQSIANEVVDTVSIATWSVPIWNRQCLPHPSLAEQTAISDYLDSKCAAIDAIIAEKESLIGELEAYKKSLIFETVTGKRRVC